MDFGQTLVAIFAIMAVAGVVRSLLGIGRSRRSEHFAARVMAQGQQPGPETDRLREEVRGLKERVAVLERLITDQSSASALDREFEKLKQLD